MTTLAPAPPPVPPRTPPPTTKTTRAAHRSLRAVVPRPALLLAATVAVGVAVVPLVYLAVRTGQAGWSTITEELATTRVASLAARSLGLAAVVTAACVIIGVGTAFLVTRTD